MDEAIRAFLEQVHSASMVTLRRDGSAHAVRVGVALVDGKLWSSGTQTRLRTRHLRRDPRSTLFAFDSEWRWLSLECTVTILDGPDAPEINLRLFEIRVLEGDGRRAAPDLRVQHRPLVRDVRRLAISLRMARQGAVMYEQIIYEKSDGIATITLNRPERMNAFTPIMLDEWLAALTDAHTDDEVRAVILTGTGRGFCTGADVSGEGLSGLVDRGRTHVQNRNFLRDSVQRIPRLVSIMEKPYIAAVNGAAVGAGMDMASMGDIRFAADTARFGMTYVRMGLVPGDGGCYFLPRIVGMSRALDLIWTGRLIDAQEARAMGYVSAVVPADELIAYTREYAMRLVKGPAVAIQQAKRLAYRSQELSLDAALDLAQQAMFIAQSTEDSREGPRAFVEKREPEFKGR